MSHRSRRHQHAGAILMEAADIKTLIERCHVAGAGEASRGDHAPGERVRALAGYDRGQAAD